MGRSGQYRLFAARCVEIARAITDSKTKAIMLQMAQVWCRIADEADELTRASGHGPPAADRADDTV